MLASHVHVRSALMDYPQFTLSFSALQQMPFFRENRLSVSTINWLEHLLLAAKIDREKIETSDVSLSGIDSDTALQPHPLKLSKNKYLLRLIYIINIKRSKAFSSLFDNYFACIKDLISLAFLYFPIKIASNYI